MSREEKQHHCPNNTIHRESIKSLRHPNSNLPAWKNTLKERCLETARNKRMLLHLQKRRAGGSSTSPSHVTKDIDMTFARSTVAASSSSPSCYVEGAARQLVEEQLRFGKIQVMPSPDPSAFNHNSNHSSMQLSSPLHTSSTIGNSTIIAHPLSSPSMMSTPTDSSSLTRNTQLQYTYTTPPTTDINTNHPGYTNRFTTYQSQQQQQQIGQGGDMNFIREDELYELMQEVEEELKKESEAFADEEMSAMEAEQDQENSIMQAHIEEYETWHSQTNCDETK